MYEKFKLLVTNDSFFLTVLLILVGIVSFGLGRQSMVENGHVHNADMQSGVVFTDVKTTPDEPVVLSEIVKVVASRSGTKFHLPDCPGASQIKEENKIYFDSIELAKAAGYTPATNCPGLKD
jgi:hypothetical protein